MKIDRKDIVALAMLLEIAAKNAICRPPQTDQELLKQVKELASFLERWCKERENK